MQNFEFVNVVKDQTVVRYTIVYNFSILPGHICVELKIVISSGERVTSLYIIQTSSFIYIIL